MLAGHKIDFVEAELSMNPENTYHISFEKLKNYIEGYNYRIFGIYEQQTEWKPSFPMLRRVNAVFVVKDLIT